MTSGRSGAATRGARRAYIDVARGLAVLLMIEAHTVDAWTRAAAKSSIGFRNATIAGGFAAPLFLWLAGVSAVLAAGRAEYRSGGRAGAADAICSRGLEIFILAFLFRLQAFVVSPGSHPVTLFRVDILNVMGPAIAITAMLWSSASSRTARATLFALVAFAVAMGTPLVRAAAWVDALPTWLQWYLRPAGEHTTFTLLPWIGFVFAGAAAGELVATAGESVSETGVQKWLALAGAALMAIGFVTAMRPSIYPSSSFWTSSPTWFAIRVGVVALALPAAYVAVAASVAGFGGEAARRVLEALARMGRNSLFVYWIHVELVYGYASWLWRGRLPLWGTLLAFGAFSTLMYAAIVLRDRVTTAWRARPAGVQSATA